MTRAWCTAVLVLGVLVSAPSVQAQTKKISYAIHELSPVVSSDSSYVREINEFGRVVGYVSDGTNRNACIWEPNDDGDWIIRDLGASEYYDNPVGAGINELGEVVGYTNTILGNPGEAFFYDDLTGSFETLPKLEGFFAVATSINNVGVVGGYSRNDDRDCATLWERTDDGTWTATNLAEMSDSVKAYSSTADINDNMQIVGSSTDYRNNLDTQVAHLWERDANGEWTITNLCGDRPGASAINNVGQIAGRQAVNDTRHACIWERVDGAWSISDLSVFASGFSETMARDINDLGQVVGVGYFVTGGSAPYLYENGVMRNLNNHLPAGASGWSLGGAWAINDYGHIVGFGYNPAGNYRGFLMDTRAVTYSYTSTGSAVSIKDKSTAAKSMTLTDTATITDLNVTVTLYHTRYADLKFELVGPNSFTRLLCNAGAVTGSGTKTLVFDDDGSAGSIVPAVPLSYYDGTSTQGKWTLKISDTVKNSKTGSFTSFTLDVVPAL